VKTFRCVALIVAALTLAVACEAPSASPSRQEPSRLVLDEGTGVERRVGPPSADLSAAEVPADTESTVAADPVAPVELGDADTSTPGTNATTTAPDGTSEAPATTTTERTTTTVRRTAPTTTRAPAPTTTRAPAPTTTRAPAPTTTRAPAPTTTRAPAPTTTQAPTTTAAPTTVPAPTTTASSSDGRTVIDASGWRGTLILDQPNTIYDFGNVAAARDITVAANNTEARNIRGTGARRIGLRDGRNYTDAGFRNFEFTYAQTQNGGGGKLIRPYFVNGTDANPAGTVGVGSPIHIYAYEGDVVDPLLQNITVRGWIADPSNPDPHNDSVHFTGISGGRVYNPTIRQMTSFSGAAHGVLMRHVWGRVTVEDSTFHRRYGAYFGFFGNGEDVSATVELLWRRNSLPDNAPGSAAAAFLDGWSVHPSSDITLPGGVVTPR
jgi:hypothetical protein